MRLVSELNEQNWMLCKNMPVADDDLDGMANAPKQALAAQ